jgi:cellulose synthase/poly-beta-1,6-N-acetylglucosamine synthase-like glycosyltransferase
MKKAGNLKYAYERSDGDFIVIFDADFSPKREFLLETLPVIMSDPLIGILQTPQYFGTSADISPRGSLEYGASYTQEDFYRVIQVARDSLGAPLCCGSNALYRRKALDTIGGTVQIEHSEDAHTGFALLSTGWKVRYLPLVLAIGLCPDHLHPYFMQHRWASGSMALMSSSKFWRSPLSIKQKLCFITGFLYYIQHPVSLIFSFQLFWTLFIYSDYLNFLNALPFYPYIFFSFVVMPLFKIHPLKFGAFYASIVQLYSYSHAVLSVITKTYTAWVPTNGKHLSLSSSFISSRRILSVYVSIYTLLLFVAIRTGDVYLFSPNFWSIQFWIAWNLFFSYFLLFKMHRESYL